MTDVLGYRNESGATAEAAQVKKILTNKIPLLNSPGTLVDNSLYYDAYNSSVQAAGKCKGSQSISRFDCTLTLDFFYRAHQLFRSGSDPIQCLEWDSNRLHSFCVFLQHGLCLHANQQQ